MPLDRVCLVSESFPLRIEHFPLPVASIRENSRSSVPCAMREIPRKNSINVKFITRNQISFSPASRYSDEVSPCCRKYCGREKYSKRSLDPRIRSCFFLFVCFFTIVNDRVDGFVICIQASRRILDSLHYIKKQKPIRPLPVLFLAEPLERHDKPPG